MKRLYYDSRLKKYNYKYTLHDNTGNIQVYKGRGNVITITPEQLPYYQSQGYSIYTQGNIPLSTIVNQPTPQQLYTPGGALAIQPLNLPPQTVVQNTTDYLPLIIGAAILIAVI